MMTTNNTQEEILHFIRRFAGNTGTIDTFCNGCCYWFAKILTLRFPGSEIVYCDKDNHFGTLIGDQIYDITGNVTEKHIWENWEGFPDDSHKRRIIRDCINF